MSKSKHYLFDEQDLGVGTMQEHNAGDMSLCAHMTENKPPPGIRPGYNRFVRGKAISVCTGIAVLIFGLGMSHAYAQVADSTLATITELINDVSDSILSDDVTRIRLGFGPVYSPDYEGSDNYKIGIKPLISFHYRNLFHIDNNHLHINILGKDALFPSSHFHAGPLVKVDFGRNEKDNPDLTGLGNVGVSVELGAFTSYTSGPTNIRIRVQKDVTNGHSGTEILADIRELLYKTDSLAVIGSFTSTWSDSNYMNSYFGVNTMQSMDSGLPVFKASSGLKDARLALGVSYIFNKSWNIIANVGYTRLLGDAGQSPIVKLLGSSNQFVSGVFVIYSF